MAIVVSIANKDLVDAVFVVTGEFVSITARDCCGNRTIEMKMKK